MSPTNDFPHTGFGLLGFSWRNKLVPDDEAFPAMKAAIEGGATIWSSSSIYGLPPYPPTAGLQLIKRYFQKYPEDAPKVTLAIRGCADGLKWTPTTTREGVRASWEECNQILGGVKSIDAFGPARMDQNVPVEETVGALKDLMDEGKIGGIVLSEVRAETINRAAAIAPIKFVEIEFSFWSTEMFDNGVSKAANEHDVAILAYAPLGYGFLTGKIKKLEDIPEKDGRRMFGRFQPETFDKNLHLVAQVEAFAAKKGATAAQVALAWVRSWSQTDTTGVIIPIPGATHPSRVIENTKDVTLTPEEKRELDELVKSITVVGHRQIPGWDANIWT
ncbi:pyridoxal reductase [Podospora fimiseda]|uniref:Pyridoxal reductase n=1 Tax=Podospora fimiseda TaxID=252190 RepID=A0AAN6YLB0_9PEZI|nr:pyridoxal reductase [Podospora fimiseda]